ncbi:MAG: ABC transporter ATP-binding protein [Nitrospirae bacterium]|nr:ABC transporter ATP-binding protein [Nitrospirota bacterium]
MIRLDDVGKAYRRGSHTLWALRGVSLEIPAGEFHVVVGPSGSGKSTLLHLMATLDVPTEGTVWLDGRATAACSDETLTLLRRDRIGLVFQAFNLLPYLTSRENVALPRLLQRLPHRQVRREADEWLDAVGLTARADHWPHELSGGEAQRVAIARALITQPRLLLADEPTGNLDSARGLEILTLLATLAPKSGVTTVLVTHSADAARFGHRTTRLRDGRIDP